MCVRLIYSFIFWFVVLLFCACVHATAAPKPKGVLGHESSEQVYEHFRTVAAVMPRTNRWDATPDTTKVDVDDSEWD